MKLRVFLTMAALAVILALLAAFLIGDPVIRTLICLVAGALIGVGGAEWQIRIQSNEGTWP